MRFEIETNQVAETVKKLQNELDAISKGRDKMFQAIEDLNGMWIGAAHDVFDQQNSMDDQLMQQLCKTIQMIIGNISKARENYDACEQSVKSTISGIHIE